MPTCKEFIDYLAAFPPDCEVGALVVDTEKRLHHITAGYDLLQEFPVLLFETTQSEPLDAILEQDEADEKAPDEAATSDQRKGIEPTDIIPAGR